MDAQDVQAAQAGDMAAFQRLFDSYKQRAYGIAYRYLNHKEDALDAVQNAFIKVYRALGSYQSQSSFYTWLARVVVNTAIDMRRSRGRHESVSYDEEALGGEQPPGRSREPRPDRAALSHDLGESINEAIDQLPEAQKTVFVLHVVEQMSYQEIADTMKISIGTVMSRLFYARKKLQKQLTAYLDA